MRPQPQPTEIRHRILAMPQHPGKKRLELFMFDEINPMFGVSAGAMRKILANNPDVEEIGMFVNSPGGLALDGVAINNALAQHPAKVDITVEGMALSAASLVVMAGDVRRIAAGGQMMIHEARGVRQGTSDDMRKFAELLESTSDQMANIYASRTGKSKEFIKEKMKEEFFMTADQAVEMGFADEVIPAKAVAANWDLDAFEYSNVPEDVRLLATGAADPMWMRERHSQALPVVAPTQDSPSPKEGDGMVPSTPIAVMSGLAPASPISDFGRTDK